MDEGKEVDVSPVISGCEASEVLEFVEATFDAVPELVFVLVVAERALAGRVRGDDELGSDGLDIVAEGAAGGSGRAHAISSQTRWYKIFVRSGWLGVVAVF